MSRRFPFSLKILNQPLGWKANFLAGVLISIVASPFMGFSSAKLTMEAMALGALMFGLYVCAIDVGSRWFHRHFMPRPQFSLKAVLWLMALVGVVLTAWQLLKLTYSVVSHLKREYLWRNGVAITVSQGGIKIETGVDVTTWKMSRLSEARGRFGTDRRSPPH
jgi:hypothetical protein